MAADWWNGDEANAFAVAAADIVVVAVIELVLSNVWLSSFKFDVNIELLAKVFGCDCGDDDDEDDDPKFSLFDVVFWLAEDELSKLDESDLLLDLADIGDDNDDDEVERGELFSDIFFALTFTSKK